MATARSISFGFKLVPMFKDWKADIDREADATKPNAAQYQEAIRLRQAMVNWLSLEREHQEQYDAMMEDMRQHQAVFPNGEQGEHVLLNSQGLPLRRLFCFNGYGTKKGLS
jgi:hypothetical protein